MNNVVLVGNVGKDPEIHSTQNSKVAKFSLATSDIRKNQQGEKITDTEWHSIACWGKLADIAEKYIKKGQMLCISGKIHYGSYDDKNGNKRYTTEIVAGTLKMIGSKNESVPEFDANHEIGDDLPY